MNKVSLSIPQVGLGAQPFTSLGIVLLTVGLVTACGHDDPGGAVVDPDAGTSVTTGTTTTSGPTTTSGTTTASDTTTTTSGTTTTTASETTTPTIDLTTDPTTGTSTDTTSATTDTTSATTDTTSATTDTTSDTDVSMTTDEPDSTIDSDCGGPGEPCCDVLACDPGLLCVGVDAINDAGSGGDNSDSDVDAGVTPLEAGMFNQLLVDASADAGEQTPFVPSADAGEQDPFVPSPIDASATNGGFPIEAGMTPPSTPVGMCEPCGGEGEQCCADDACGEGLSCDTIGFGPNATSSCETVVPPEGDGGDEIASCGTLGAQCCPGGGGECEEGLDCQNGPMRGLGDSECVSAAAESDSGLR